MSKIAQNYCHLFPKITKIWLKIATSGHSANSGSDSSDNETDNCSEQKMNSAIEEAISGGFDVIAKVLYNHPTIQAVMENNL